MLKIGCVTMWSCHIFLLEDGDFNTLVIVLRLCRSYHTVHYFDYKLVD